MSDWEFFLKPSTLLLLALIIVPVTLLEGYYGYEERIGGKVGVLGAASMGLLVGIIATMAVFGLLSSR